MEGGQSQDRPPMNGAKKTAEQSMACFRSDERQQTRSYRVRTRVMHCISDRPTCFCEGPLPPFSGGVDVVLHMG